MSHLEPDVIEATARAKAEGAVAAHLADCAECRGHVQRARGRQQLLSGLKPYTLSDMAFRRVEARLKEAVEAGDAAPSRRWAWWLGGALAFGLAAALVVLPGEGPQAPWTVKLPTPRVALSEVPFHPLTVLSAAPQTQAHRGDEPWKTLAVGDVVNAGDALSSTALLLAPADDAAWSLQLSGSLSLGGAASLTLGAGEVVAQVGSPLTVLASSWRVGGSSALFSLSRTGAEVVLNVAEGEVEVVDTLTAERRVVKAPMALRWSDGSKLAEGREEPLRALSAPKVPSKPWSRFDASGLAPGTVVTLDGVRVGVAPFMELVTGGRRRLGLTPPGGALRESWAELIGGQPYTPKVELPGEVDGPEPDAEALERVMAAIKLQRPKLAACYEKWLKANRDAEGEVVLELLVNAQGRVKRASVERGTVSAPSAECLVTTAKTLVLPPLGAEATLQVPLLLRQPGH